MYSGTSSGRRSSPILFSQIEVRDILIAWAALALAFTIASRGGLAGNLVTAYFVAFVAVGSGFVLHELMHKFTAERYGYWAEFRMWVMGIVLALVTSTLGVIFAAPGATYISGMNISKEENGVISIAGPLMNIVIAVLFLPFALFGTGNWGTLGAFGTYINIFLALFNMLPIGPLDGSKVFRWNLAVWAATFGGLALTFVYLFLP